MEDETIATTSQRMESPLDQGGVVTAVSTEPNTCIGTADEMTVLKPSKRMGTGLGDFMHSVNEYSMEGSGEDGDRQLSKKRRGSDFRCPYFAANPETCQDAKCKSWHNPSIAAVTRHALRDSAKNDETGRQSRAIRSLSHRKLSAEDRWTYYYEIHGGVGTDEQRQPYWPRSTTGDKVRKAEHAAALEYDEGLPLTGLSNLDDILQAFLQLLSRKEARDSDIDTEIKKKEAERIAALRGELAQEKLVEKSRNQSEFLAGLKRIIMHSQLAPDERVSSPPTGG